jgi:hypothetical protein
MKMEWKWNEDGMNANLLSYSATQKMEVIYPSKTMGDLLYIRWQDILCLSMCATTIYYKHLFHFLK